MSIYFNRADYSDSNTTSVSTKLNLSQLTLTGPMNSVGITNSSIGITTSSNLSLTGTAKFSMQTGAVSGHVLTSDATGSASWLPNSISYDATSQTTNILGTALTHGITNDTNVITSNTNINLTGSSKLKYPTGINGHTLISNDAGLLTLSPFPSEYISYIVGSMNAPFTHTTNSTQTLGTITLNTGLWMIYYRFGVKNESVGTISLTGIHTQLHTASGNIQTSDSIEITASASIANLREHHFAPHMFIYDCTENNRILTFKGHLKTGVSVPITWNLSGSYCYALKLGQSVLNPPLTHPDSY